jgi:putative nucleotidyltransferase with HDIG domain
LNAPAAAIDHLELLASAEGLGAMPVTVTQLATLVSDPNHQLREVVDLVSLDQALTASLLRRANSASLGARAQIKTVRDAAVRLGSGTILAIALASTVSGKMRRALPAYGLAEGQLWRQSVAAAVAAEAIRAHAKVEVPCEAPTAALLHDFGKVVLSHHFGPQVLALLSRAAKVDEMDLLEAEVAVFGVNHADIGGMIAQQWKLPHSIVDAIIHHHSADHTLMPVNAAVSLAHAMVPDVLVGAGGGPRDQDALPVFETHLPVMVKLGLDPKEYVDLLQAAQARYWQLASRYDMS